MDDPAREHEMLDSDGPLDGVSRLVRTSLVILIAIVVMVLLVNYSAAWFTIDASHGPPKSLTSLPARPWWQPPWW